MTVTSKINFFIESETDMLTLGQQLAKYCPRHMIIFLNGELGTGKTTLVKGFLSELGYTANVKSPTYTLVEPYHLLDRDIYHFDLYRLGSPEELEYIGIRDYFHDNATFLVEWPVRGFGFLPEGDMIITLSYDGGERRHIDIESKSRSGGEFISHMVADQAWAFC